MTFGEVQDALMTGRLATRMAWGSGAWLRLMTPEETDTVTRPVYIVDRPSPPEAYPGGERMPWSPTHEDLFEDDWLVIE